MAARTTTTRPRVARTPRATAAPDSGYPGQYDQAGILRLLQANRDAAEAARSAFLKSNPDYLPCAVAGCQGLVGPNFQRTAADGTKWGLCPRRDQHQRLMPDVFTAPNRAARGGVVTA